MQLDRLAFNQDRLKRLNAQTVQGRRAVQHHRMLADHFIQDIPDFRAFLFHQFLGLLDGAGQTLGLKPGIDERLEQLQGHLFRQTTLVQVQFRAGHDDRTTGKVDAFAQKVLAKTALFTLQHIRQRFQRAFVGPGNHPATAAVVKQRINRFLQHPLFVAHDDIRCAQFDQAFQAVVAVDDAAVKVVQVGRGKPATIQRHQRAQFRRNDRDHGHHHPFRAVAGIKEVFDDFQPLDDLFGLQFAGGDSQIGTQLVGFGLQINLAQHFTDRFGPNTGVERVGAVLIFGVQKFLFGHQLAVDQVSQAGFDHHILFKIQNAFQIAQRHVQHQADAAGQRFQKPDMRNRGGQFDMAHAFAAYLLQGDFDAAFFAGHTAVFHPLVFAAQTFVIFDRAKDTGAEQAVPLWFEGPIVDGFRLFDLAEGP